ncbi:MAG TPA: hypothetical protein VGQ57_18755 [Polyangiaceae bacterium]|jgi:hypothetical protein|nr:hypothetical protein [Polyangiaceae bacterium]
MKDPERLVHGSPDALAGRLLRAGAAEAPPSGGVERTLAAIGVATGALGTAGTAGALGAASAGKAATTLSLLGVAKWAGIGMAGGIAVSLTAHGLGTLQAGRASPSNTASHAVTAGERAPATPKPQGPRAGSTAMALPSAEATQDVNAAGSAPPHNARAATSPSSPLSPSETNAPLAAEVGFVDRARALFQRGDARAALAALAPYERSFPEPRLLPEVLFLRMEALARSGNAPQAADVARVIVREFGKGPHAAKARALLAQP